MTQDGSSLMGVQLAPLTEAQLCERIIQSLGEERGGWVITTNLDQLRQLRADPSLLELFSAADVVVADGMPLVWVSRLQGTPLPERVAGSDVVWSLAARAAATGRSLYLLGDVDVVRAEAERMLRRRFPALRIVGGASPALDPDPDPAAVERIRQELAELSPDIVYVALGFPKQERLIAALRSGLPTTWFIGVGISLSFISGHVRRAPRWASRLGLEWAHRLVQEPRRLARRYLVHGLPFALRMTVHAVGVRVRGSADGWSGGR